MLNHIVNMVLLNVTNENDYKPVLATLILNKINFQITIIKQMEGR